MLTLALVALLSADPPPAVVDAGPPAATSAPCQEARKGMDDFLQYLGAKCDANRHWYAGFDPLCKADVGMDRLCWMAEVEQGQVIRLSMGRQSRTRFEREPNSSKRNCVVRPAIHRVLRGGQRRVRWRS